MSRSYMQVLGTMSPTMGGVKHVTDMVAALAPPGKAAEGAAALAKTPEPKASVTDVLKDWAPSLVGAGVGAFAWKGHRLLGATIGHALASTAKPIITGNGRKRAFCQLATEGAAVAGALMWKKHPFFGWLAGLGVGAVATSFVSESPSRELWNKWKRAA